MMPVREKIKAGNMSAAINAFEKANLDKEGRNRLLYHIEKGLLYHLAGKYKESNYYLERAEWISDELYTRSLSLKAASLITSDLILDWRGHYYDFLFINYYKLLNFLHLGDFSGVLVEVRRISHKLALFNKENAFLHYLTAIFYQHNNQISDAFIAYKKAFKLYSGKNYNVPMPNQLKRDLSVFYGETGFSRFKELPSEILNLYRPPREYGTVVFLIETDFVPHKYEKRIEMMIPREYKKKYSDRLKDVYYLSIAIPQYKTHLDSINKVNLKLNNEYYTMDLVADIGAMVIEIFNENKPNIIAKSIARAITKYVSYRKVRGKDDADTLRRILGASVNILSVATEKADTRSWLTLPNRIFLSRHYLKPGIYEFNITVQTEKGISEKFQKQEFTVCKGELKFIVLRKIKNLPGI